MLISKKAPPLVVDLDGTLLKSDLLFETSISFLKENPSRFLDLFKWLCEGKAKLKGHLAKESKVDIQTLPYNEEVITFIKECRTEGQEVVLATASHIDLAKRIATHLELFDSVIATSGTLNLSSHRKKDALVELYGDKGFDYIGNSKDDLAVWKSSRKVYLVNPEWQVEKKANNQGQIDKTLESRPNLFNVWLKAIRLHQWIKNFLIFVPLLAAHKLTDIKLIAHGMLAFILFGLCASSVYILNDILDIADDRHHPTKKNRAFASGAIPIKFGLIACPILLTASIAGACTLLNTDFTIALISYYIITLAYSLKLKREVSIDVVTLALLYTMRIIAGALAFGLQLTFWMLAFSIFMFLSLALVKRYTELYDARKKGKTTKTRGRGYYPSDIEMISSLGAASGYLSVMVLALYLHDEATTAAYRYPHAIWLTCPLLLLWITRMWMLAHRGQMHDDPVVFALKDRVSILTGVLFCGAFWIAT